MTTNNQQTPVNGNTPVPPTSPVLVSGLSIWRGTVTEEYLAELKPWSRAYKIYREMSDDPVIGTLAESIKVPLLDAKMTVEPASPADADIEAAEWLEANTIFNERFSWKQHVEEAFSFLNYGWFICDKVLEKDPEDGRLWLADLIPIGHDTLLRWGSLDPHGNVTSFVQQAITEKRIDANGNVLSPGPTIREAPLDRLLHFTFRGSKRNPEGRSLFRALYRPWYFAKNLEVVEAIGAERDVGNVPLIILGEGYYTDTQIQEIKDAASGLRMDEAAYMILPNGTDARPFGAGGKVYDVRTIIRDYHHLIRQRFFMDFVSLGSEQVGTQALAKEVTSFFSLALGAVQAMMVETWTRQLVTWLFRWNINTFPDITGLPTIKWSRPGKINVQGVAQAASSLVSSGLLTITDSTEDYFREQFEFPPISDEERQMAEEQSLAAQQQFVNPQVGGRGNESPPGEVQGGTNNNLNSTGEGSST